MKRFLLPCLLSSFVACTSSNPDSQTSNNSDAAEASRKSSAVPGSGPEGMVWIPGGKFVMGSESDLAHQVEGPTHEVEVKGFWMDETEVTNAQFRAFVEATGYQTVAERPVDWEELKKQVPPGTPKPPEEVLQPGSLVFTPPDYPVPLADMSQWWSWVNGADWKHPRGPQSSIEGQDDYPVVHIAYEDAQAYAEWAGKRLPTEAEWEFAARGGQPNQAFAWGDELTPNGEFLANFFQGHFPHDNTAQDGFPRSAPVKSFPPNDYGLYDMIGNVWEWSTDWYRPDTYSRRPSGSEVVNPTGPADSWDPQDPYNPKRVTKGGSFLCSNEFCWNYRPSARMATAFDSGQEHLGFRCVQDAE